MKSPFLIVLLYLFVSNAAYSQGYSLRFFGHGIHAMDADRVKIRIDDPNQQTDKGPPIDVGATDFTIEFWMKGAAGDNTAPSISCGPNYDWIYGNIMVDRDRFNQGRAYGISIGGGVPVFGVLNEFFESATICGTRNVLDGKWHHIVCQRRRSDGWIWLFVDGMLEAEIDGPDGDISYPDDGMPGNYCNGPCVNSDPFVVLGAEKHDAGAEFPSFNGSMDELRYSTLLRYADNFIPPTLAFETDSHTAALFHFDEGEGSQLTDASNASNGPSNGTIRYGGSPMGPTWSKESPISMTTFLTQPFTEKENIGIYPNPTRGVFFIENIPRPRIEATLVNLLGQPIWQERLNESSPQQINALQHLAPGFYILHLAGIGSFPLHKI